MEAYAKVKIKDTNKAATKTKEQSQTLRIKNELKYLQIKKSGINNNLYYLQNDGVKIYGENWPIIENQIHGQIKHIINKTGKKHTFVGWDDGGKVGKIIN